MSSHDVDEPMDCSELQPATSRVKYVEDSDEVEVTLSVKWSEDEKPQKSKVELQKVLQTWANSHEKAGKRAQDCTVVNVSEDGRAVLRIKPAPAVSDLQELSGQTLPRKDGKTVTITSVSLSPQETQIPEDASVNIPPFVSEPQHEQVQLDKQSSFRNSAAVSTAGVVNCVVPVGHFWYVSHIYKEAIKHIEKANGITIKAEVNVFFEGGQKDESQQEALSEFTELVQKCIGESHSSVIPLKCLDAEELKDTLKIIERPKNKLLLALSSEEMTIYGPKQSQDAISRSLKGAQKTLTNVYNFAEESTRSSQTTGDIGMSVKDALIDAGLTIEESYWRLMTTSFSENLAEIKTKFGVHLKESGIGQGKVEVKAVYNSPGGNVSMESHAVRALLRLYQKIVTSPMNFTYDGMGFSGSPKSLNNVYTSEGASNEPVLNSQSKRSMFKTQASTEEGATAGDREDENCSICQDTLTKEKQLKCGHVFCEECVASAMKSMGPICPLCKDVFGIMKGNQPAGEMSLDFLSSSLPGFKGCRTIVISYYIPDGKQTEEHPNPGKYYHGVVRKAYLPDNKKGNEVLRLLKKAFAQKLIFTVGTSITTGRDNQVTWNDIHHKTAITGGSENFGYPDPDYLSRVTEELKAKGIK